MKRRRGLGLKNSTGPIRSVGTSPDGGTSGMWGIIGTVPPGEGTSGLFGDMVSIPASYLYGTTPKTAAAVAAGTPGQEFAPVPLIRTIPTPTPPATIVPLVATGTAPRPGAGTRQADAIRPFVVGNNPAPYVPPIVSSYGIVHPAGLTGGTVSVPAAAVAAVIGQLGTPEGTSGMWGIIGQVPADEGTSGMFGTNHQGPMGWNPANYPDATGTATPIPRAPVQTTPAAPTTNPPPATSAATGAAAGGGASVATGGTPGEEFPPESGTQGTDGPDGTGYGTGTGSPIDTAGPGAASSSSSSSSSLLLPLLLGGLMLLATRKGTR